MDIDETLYVVLETVRTCREVSDAGKRSAWESDTLGLLKESILKDKVHSPSEALCAFLAITLHMKRSHGLPGPTTLEEMSQTVCKR